MQPDIDEYVRRNFEDTDVAAALKLLESAILHDGRPVDARMLRCALAACDNTLQSLNRFVADLAVDYRDVIAAGEYGQKDGEYVRIRDYSKHFDGDAV